MADEAREIRECASCGVSDTHAHHVQFLAFIHPVTGKAEDLSVSRHVQCCAADGCEICSTDVEHLGAGAPSDEFTAAMQDKSDDHHRALYERHGVESPSYRVTA